MADTRCIKTSTRTDTVLKRNISKKTHPDTRRRRIPDAHLTDAEHTTPLLHTVIDKTSTYLNSLVKLLDRHRRLIEEVLRATRYLPIDDTRHSRKVVIDTHIDNAKMEAVLTAEHIHTTTATREVDHLLPRDFARRHTDTLALDAMITTQQQMTRMSQRRRKRPLHKAYLHGQFLQSPKRTLRFVQVVYLLLDCILLRAVERLDIE